ncbi:MULTISPECIES: APH(3'') family aminoglycoside O-phosphotransferase [Mycobacteroides]|uniref:APH(3'') family aminoglycoside O-phosphotransferase n=1 Tax=Mycobacteroides chelonae TaxID=1774 RepID=A0A1S1LUU4_MYCCH|nr:MULTISPECIES: APH(3'') family aminoglycoside O-phosphotransferase [Mycobacteroides]KRQ25269.1 3'-kinase [Mycobacteroides sp. H003]KRQ28044.1 3'-kinase [Mycobacteroides sp. H092]KRQ34738.1 3'-kinase [Mycobacteroides sp. H101]KRQ53130.1 3'-kinase [Mycobacteroides sp. H063]KRQ60222.1 3'-kinase [Mycobacteroides sp. H079]
MDGRLIDLSAWEPVTTGESGALVYRSADRTRYAKAGGADLEAERDRIDWLSTRDVPGPKVLEWTPGPSGPVLITSAVRGTPADQLDADDLDRTWPAIAETVRRLHALPTAQCPFTRNLDAMMALARDVVARDAVNPDFLPDEDRDVPAAELLARIAADVPARLAQETGDLAVCHGDLCLPNILVAPDGFSVAGLIDLGRLGLADRHADLALLFANSRDTWPEDTRAATARGRFLDVYGTRADPDRLKFYLQLDPLTWG